MQIYVGHICLELALMIHILEGAKLEGVHFEGQELSTERLQTIRHHLKGFPNMLPPADLQGVFLNATTTLEDITLGNEKMGFVSLADVRWGGVDLTVVDWTPMKVL